VETALRLGKRVLPVLINDTRMPEPAALPPAIAQLHRFQAAVFHTNQHVKADLDRLILTLQQVGVLPLVAWATAAGAAVPAVQMVPRPARRRSTAGMLFSLVPRVVGGSILLASMVAVVGIGALTVYFRFTPSQDEQELRATLTSFCSALHQRHYTQA